MLRRSIPKVPPNMIKIAPNQTMIGRIIPKILPNIPKIGPNMTMVGATKPKIAPNQTMVGRIIPKILPTIIKIGPTRVRKTAQNPHFSRFHPFLGSSEKCLPGVMKTEEPENQVTLVTQTIMFGEEVS